VLLLATIFALRAVASDLVAPAVSPDSPDSARELSSRISADQYRGWSLAIDNDLFAPPENDRDYTGGAAVTLSGTRTASYWWSPDRLLRRLDTATVSDAFASTAPAHYSVQAGVLMFTPQDTTTPEMIRDDRPYASLLYVTSARQYVDTEHNRSRQTALTIGILGLPLASSVHGAVHDLVGSPRPQGYANQISAGGELTARYVVGGSRLRSQRIALGSGLLETKTTAELSVGYLTEASYAISTRLGQIDTPWWTFNPERVDYIMQPSSVARARGPGELYFWAGAKVRLRAYNALLQGQFRDSAHTLGPGDVRHVIGEAWFGLTSQLANGTQMSYAVRYQTADLADGVGHRNPVWAGIIITHAFR
jgi:hypothetical protein